MTDPSPQDHECTEDDDDRWLDACPPLTPEEDFAAFFEAWQDAAEDRHL